MKWIRETIDYIYAYKEWYLLLLGTNALFMYLAWLAYPDTFHVLVRIMIIYIVSVIVLSILFIMRKKKRVEVAFQVFLADPNEENEGRLCRVSPKIHRSFIRRTGNAMRINQTELNDQVIELADYESFIEGWVHEVKKPLSLLNIVLDNRSNEMSAHVRHRMFHVRDQILGDVERILYYARLGSVHKDYIFAPLNIVAFCRETINNHQTLVDDSVFQIQFVGDEIEVISDRKGLAFILEQIIFNSMKYARQNEKQAMLKFEVGNNEENDDIILHITDNGPGVPDEDIPFIFDKGFTGGRGNYTDQATGIGLYLVRKMAKDLAIKLDAKSERDAGLTISIIFPSVK